MALDDGATERIGRFLDLLELWNRRVRLVSTRERVTLLSRHIVDSLAPVPHLPAEGLVIDVGSGAGFPGIVIGCARPTLGLALLESRRRRASFLAEVIRSIPLPGTWAFEMRAEDAARSELRGRARVAIARALRLDQLLMLARPLLAPGGIVIAMQTPRIAADAAAAVAARNGLHPVGIHHYVLPGGEKRSLLMFGAEPGAVS